MKLKIKPYAAKDKRRTITTDNKRTIATDKIRTIATDNIRTRSACIGEAATGRPLSGAIPLLLHMGVFGC